MRQAIRTGVAIAFAFLFQSTILPFFRIQGVLIDLLTITVFAAGYAGGLYTGIVGGLGAALLLEVISGDLSGLVTVAAVAAGAWGALTAKNLHKISLAGRRNIEKVIRRLGPMISVGLFCAAKELVYALYFYLTGVDFTWYHAGVVLLSGLIGLVASIVLLPAIQGFMCRAPEDTFIARWNKRRKAREKTKQKPAAKTAPAAPEGGTES